VLQYNRTCNREVKNTHRERKKTYCRSKKKYLDINMQKMFGFLDEKYTPGNMENMHAKRTKILVKHAS
jgi:hypothetical protein